MSDLPANRFRLLVTLQQMANLPSCNLQEPAVCTVAFLSKLFRRIAADIPGRHVSAAKEFRPSKACIADVGTTLS